ncbi:thioredoxin domain-containing protein 16 isoform X2 [Petromyzon marinus]|uniref:thioredoxin domain-containing protein 16 isoform X2 n=1 Tax=Petromyzon marinus TaxID=7757 RepID=UPI003F6FE608
MPLSCDRLHRLWCCQYTWRYTVMLQLPLLLLLQQSGLSLCTVPTLKSTDMNTVVNSPYSSLIYFKQKSTIQVKHFLKNLDNASELLKQYAISVWQVDCQENHVERFCEKDNIINKAYLFQLNKLPQPLYLDTLFDVDSIMANTLHLLLMEEVRFVQDKQGLQILKDTEKGRRDVVFAYLRATGLPEHRIFIEMAFVYGNKFIFAFSTDQNILKDLGVLESSFSPHLWLINCGDLSLSDGQPCPETAFRQPFTLPYLHRFFKLASGPSYVETTEDPAHVQTIFSELHIPEVFLFSRRETYQYDKITARTLSHRLLGSAGVVLVRCEEHGVAFPTDFNVAYRGANPSTKVEHLLMQSFEAVITRVEREETHGSEQEPDHSGYGQPQEEDDYDPSSSDFMPLWAMQDDEVVMAVEKIKNKKLNLEESVPALTDVGYQRVLSQPNMDLVIFYLGWDAVSKAFLWTFAEVAKKISAFSGVGRRVSPWRVDCAEWTDVCQHANVSRLPAVLLFSSLVQRPTAYPGTLSRDALLSWVAMIRVDSPLPLHSVEEAMAFLRGDLPSCAADLCNASVLALLTVNMPAEITAFVEASKALRGEVLMGLCITDRVALDVSTQLGSSIPSIIVFKRGEPSLKTVVFPRPISADVTVKTIRDSSQPAFAELSVSLLPELLRVGRPLLILFVGGRNGASVSAMRTLEAAARSGALAYSTACWMDIVDNPVGSEILETYLPRTANPPELVLVNPHRGAGQVYAFPKSDKPLTASAISMWLSSIRLGNLQPTAVLPDKTWPPSRQNLDFLAIMDAESPGFAENRQPNGADTDDRDAGDSEEDYDDNDGTEHSGQEEWSERDLNHRVSSAYNGREEGFLPGRAPQSAGSGHFAPTEKMHQTRPPPQSQPHDRHVEL